MGIASSLGLRTLISPEKLLMASNVGVGGALDTTPRSLNNQGLYNVVIPSAPSITFTTVMSAWSWIRTIDVTQNTGIFAKSNYVQNKRCYGVETWDAGKHLGIMISSDGTVGKFWVADNMHGINDGLWHLVGFSLDTDPSLAFKLWVDAEEEVDPNKVTDGTFTTLNVDATTEQTILSLLDGNTIALPINGKSYTPGNANIALNASQWAELYNGGAGITDVSELSFASNVKSIYFFRPQDSLAVVHDDSGNGNNGVYSGSLSDFTSDVPTPLYALEVNNGVTNENVSVPHSASINYTTALTFMWCMRFTDASSEQVIICKADFGQNKRSWFAEKYFLDPTRIGFFLSGTGSGSQKVIYTPINQNDNTFHSWGLSWATGETPVIWKDGVDITSVCTVVTNDPLASLFQSVGVPLIFGSGYSNGAATLPAKSVELNRPYTYGVKFTSAQALAWHQAAFAQENLMALDTAASCGSGHALSSDVDTPTTFIDQSGNGNTGTGANLAASNFVVGGVG